MMVNSQRRTLGQHGFVWMMVIAISIVCSAIIQAAPVMASTLSPTQPSAKTDQNEWNKVLAAAKKEGKIVVMGTFGEEWRKSQVDMFQREYPGISVEFSTGVGRNFWPRITQEREFGKKLWDLRVSGGNDPATFEAIRDGVLTPIRPLLLPEIAVDSKWIGGLDGVFVDNEKKYIFTYTLYTSPTVRVNRDFIKEPDLKSSAQLLDPKFKGRIVMLNPIGGATQQALAHMAFMYGENFVRELLTKQGVIITDDNRQQVEWVVRGKYPIATNFAPTMLIPFKQQGLGRNIVNLEDKIIRLSTGSGSVFLFEGAPHPNAAKVYVNWLLSQKTQIMLTENVKTNSSRTDVPPVDKETAVDPTQISKFRNSSTEENKEVNDSIIPLIKEALKH